MDTSKAYYSLTEVYLNHIFITIGNYLHAKLLVPDELIKIYSILKKEVATKDASKEDIQFCWEQSHKWGIL